MKQAEYEKYQAMGLDEFTRLPDNVKFEVMSHARELLQASSRMSELAKKLADSENAKVIMLDTAKKLQVATMAERKQNRINALRDEIVELESDITAIEKQFPNVTNWRKQFVNEIAKVFAERKQARETRKAARIAEREKLVKELQALAEQTKGLINPA